MKPTCGLMYRNTPQEKQPEFNLTTFGALKAAHLLYIWSRTNTPTVGITLPGDGRIGTAASSAAVKSVAQTSLGQDAFSA
jgi:hypothetical protein